MSSKNDGLETPNFQKPLTESLMDEFFTNEKNSKLNLEQLMQDNKLEEEIYATYNKVQLLPLKGESEEEREMLLLMDVMDRVQEQNKTVAVIHLIINKEVITVVYQD